VATTLMFASGATTLASKNLFLTRSLFLKFSKVPRYIARISDMYDRGSRHKPGPVAKLNPGFAKVASGSYNYSM
jgi:hypothetical protein